MSAKSCDNCKMIMVNYVDLWLVYSHVASLLDGARLELKELKSRSTLLGACTSCPLLRSDLEAAAVEIKDLKHKLDYPSRYNILSPLCETCVSLKGKLFYATEENTQLQQEVTYLTARLEKTVLSEKIIEEDLSRIEKSATKSTYKLGVEFERCENKGEKSAPKFIPSSSYHKDEATIKSTKAHYPSNTKPSFNPKREVRKETSKLREEAFACIFYSHTGHLDEFCFCRKRIEKMRFEYARNSYHDEFLDFLPHFNPKREVRKETSKLREKAFVYMFYSHAGHLDEFCFCRKRIEKMRFECARNSYHDEFLDFLPHSYSCVPSRSYSHALPRTSSRALPQFAHGPNHHSYGFGL
jgi:hypothetical protein